MAPLTPAHLISIHPNKYGTSNKLAMWASPVFLAPSMFSRSSSLYSEPSPLCEVVPFQLEGGSKPPKTIRLCDEDFARPLPPTPPSTRAIRYLRQAKLAQQKCHTLNHIKMVLSKLQRLKWRQNAWLLLDQMETKTSERSMKQRHWVQAERMTSSN